MDRKQKELKSRLETDFSIPPQEFAKLSKEISHLSKVTECVEELEDAYKQLSDIESMID